MTFVFTPKMQSISNRIWTITSAASAGLCGLVFITAVVSWLHRRCRPHLDRVSFRLVMYALLGQTALGAAGAAAGSLAAPSWGCGFSVFIFQYCLEFTNFMLFCVALNLQLVVVHRCNGRRMEKFYIIGSILISGALTIPPYAADQYGRDPLEDDCWYGDNKKGPRISWEIGTQLTWGTLTALGELCASTTVIMILLINYLRRKQIFGQSSSTGPRVLYGTNYKRIVLRVALYPMVSCGVTVLGGVASICSPSWSGVQGWKDYNFLLLSDFLYGGRGILYALLATSDPALIRGIRSLLNSLCPSYIRERFPFLKGLESQDMAERSRPRSNKRHHLTIGSIQLSALPGSPLTSVQLSGTTEMEVSTKPEAGDQGQSDRAKDGEVHWDIELQEQTDMRLRDLWTRRQSQDAMRRSEELYEFERQI